jgi:hypothetical protein
MPEIIHLDGEQLSAVIDAGQQALTPEVHDHLDTCPVCAQRMEQLRMVAEAVASSVVKDSPRSEIHIAVAVAAAKAGNAAALATDATAPPRSSDLASAEARTSPKADTSPNAGGADIQRRQGRWSAMVEPLTGGHWGARIAAVVLVLAGVGAVGLLGRQLGEHSSTSKTASAGATSVTPAAGADAPKASAAPAAGSARPPLGASGSTPEDLGDLGDQTTARSLAAAIQGRSLTAVGNGGSAALAAPNPSTQAPTAASAPPATAESACLGAAIQAAAQNGVSVGPLRSTGRLRWQGTSAQVLVFDRSVPGQSPAPPGDRTPFQAEVMSESACLPLASTSG